MPGRAPARPRVGLGPLATPYVIAGEAGMLLLLWWDLGYPSFARLLSNLLGHGEWVIVGGSGAGFGVLAYLAVETVRLYRKTREQQLRRRAERVDMLVK